MERHQSARASDSAEVELDALRERQLARPVDRAGLPSTYGAGGILSTLRDWARWDDALADGRVLSPRGMELLTSPQVLADGGATDYAFGLEIDEFRGQRRFSHSGQTQGFGALYETFPDRDVGVMVFVNQYQTNPAPVFDALTIRALPDLSYNRLVAPADPDPARTDAVRRAIRQYYLGEQPFDLLDPELGVRAIDSSTATHRARHREAVVAMENLVYIRTLELGGGLGERHLYRMSGGGETSYFTVGVRDGGLHRLRWERE